MPVTFNADEIFEMAEEIERAANGYYKEVAGKTSDPETRTMFLDLANMEKGHEETFKQMRKQLTDEMKEVMTFDPQNEAAMYLRTFADTQGFEGKIGPDQKLSGEESMEEILNIALNAEKHSVSFYLGIKNLVPSQQGKEKIQGIIAEEMKHITNLNQRLLELHNRRQ